MRPVSVASVDSSLLGDDDVLRDAAIREVSQAVFSIRSVRRLYPSTEQAEFSKLPVVK
jgi:hypothetical protein